MCDVKPRSALSPHIAALCFTKDRAMKSISGIIGAGVGVIFGLFVKDFIHADKCLDLGGAITSWGACQFDGERAQYLSLPITTLGLVVVTSMMAALIVSLLVNSISKKIRKT